MSNDLVSKRPISDKIGACVWPYYSNFNSQVAAVKSLGMKYISVGVYLDRSNGFAFPTSEMQNALTAAKNNNLGLMVDWTGTQTGLDSTTHSFFSPSELGTIKAQIIAGIQQMAGNGVIYLGWNEPNGVFWLNNTPAAMTDYDTVKSSTDMEIWIAKQEKALDNSCIVAGPSFIYCPDYMPNNRKYVNLIAEMGIFNYIDAVNEHPYMAQSNPYNNGNPEQMLIYDNLKVANLPKITNEFGYTHKVINASAWQGFWSQRDAAKLTLRQILMMDYLGYSIICLYTAEFGTNNMSIFFADGSLTEVAKGIKWLIGELDGYTFDGKIEITEHVGYVDDLYLMKYTKDGANDKLVYWTPSRMGELYGLIYQNNFYKLKFSDYPQILEAK